MVLGQVRSIPTGLKIHPNPTQWESGSMDLANVYMYKRNDHLLESLISCSLIQVDPAFSLDPSHLNHILVDMHSAKFHLIDLLSLDCSLCKSSQGFSSLLNLSLYMVINLKLDIIMIELKSGHYLFLEAPLIQMVFINKSGPACTNIKSCNNS